MMSDRKEVLEKEVNVNFTIQNVKVIMEKLIGVNDEYRKLRIVIEDGEKDKITHEQILSDFLTFNSVLKQIAELHKIYSLTQNEKLKEGAKEEILKLIAILIWMME